MVPCMTKPSEQHGRTAETVASQIASDRPKLDGKVLKDLSAFVTEHVHLEYSLVEHINFTDIGLYLDFHSAIIDGRATGLSPYDVRCTSMRHCVLVPVSKVEPRTFEVAEPCWHN